MKPARPALLVFALLVSGLSLLGSKHARAADDDQVELPNDTNTIETLTVEQARRLVRPKVLQGLPGVEVPDQRRALPLDGLTTVDAETAAAIAEFSPPRPGPTSGLFLNGLTTLDVAAAAALAGFKGDNLHLDGLTAVSGDVAEALAQYKNHLSLNGLTKLSDEASKGLAQHTGTLHLNGLTTLSDEAAKGLAGYRGALLLGGLNSLSAEAAEALGRGRSTTLHLDGLATLSAETAEALAQRERLSLRGLVSLEPAAAEALVTGLDCRRCHADVSTPDLLKKECRSTDGKRKILLIGAAQVEPGP